MNEVMQIESVCNTTNVAQHIPQSTASTIIDNGGAPNPSVPQSLSTPAALPTVTAIANNITAISASATPMVFTVNQQQASTGAPVLKLVSPVDRGAPQLIKVVPASAVVNPAVAATGSSEQVCPNVATTNYSISDCINHIATTTAITTIYQNTGTVAVVQKMNDGQNGQNQPAEGNVVSQRVYSIVSANQPKIQQQPINTTVVNSAIVPKVAFNNGQQRIHTLTTLPTNARVIPANSASNAASATQKVQILSNVVVSKQNIVLNKTSLQAQRQIITNIAQKQNSAVPKSVDTGKTTIPVQQTQSLQSQSQTQQIQQQLVAPKIQTVNNVVITTNQTVKPVINNAVNQKPLKTVNVMNRSMQQSVGQPAKTVKTLSPGSPQPGYVQKTTGVKTLSPNMTNHYNKITNQIKMMPQAPIPPRVGGIKTLNAKNMSLANNRSNNLPPKPNYIGKHASQAQKAQSKSGMQGGVKNRNMSSQRPNNALSPKYNNQKSTVLNPQAMTAQILQSMSSSGTKNVSDGGYSTTKHYSLQSTPDDTSLSEDIGEEVSPDFSPNLSYLYQVVMLDHNYGAPPPPLSPPPVMSRSSSAQHTSPVGSGSALNGALLAAAGREREREKEREEKIAAATAYYNATSTSKRHGRHSGVSSQASQPSLPYSTPANNILPNNSTMESRNNTLTTTASSVQDDDAGSIISSEGGHVDDGDEGEETETAPEGEGDEDGVTRCICDFDHDDGYMISCDICLSWQHVDCMGLDRNAIPEKYQCVRCQPRRVDRQHARAIQLRKREDFIQMGALPRDTTANTGGPVGSGSGNASDTSSETSTAESTGETQHNTHYSRHSTGKLSVNNNLISKKRGAPVSLSARRKSEPAGHNRRGPLAHKRQQRRESARETSLSAGSARRTAAMKKREKKIKTIKRKIKSRSSVDDDSQDSWHGVASIYSNNMGASIMQLRQWIENYEEAVTNHYSPELRARISNIRANGTHNTTNTTTGNQQPGADKQAPPTAQADVAVQKCKVSGQPLTGMKIVLATQPLPQNSPVIELRGKYMLSTQHRTSAGPGSGSGAGGLQTRQHTQRPGPFLFFYRLPRDGTEVCVDTRTYGNDARFIRRSCRPNAELRHLVEKGTLHLYVITTTNVEKNSELTIKHESHDLAAVAAAASSANNVSQAASAIAAAGIQCACGSGPQGCGLFNNNRKNGGTVVETNATPNVETTIAHRKRRGRRASTPNRVESPPPQPETIASPTPTATNQQHHTTEATVPPPPPALSTRRASSHQRAVAAAASTVTPGNTTKSEINVERERETRDRDRDREEHKRESAEIKDKKKKMTREERKMEAIMKAIERMEKADQRKQELQARQAQRRESDPVDTHHQPQKQHTTSKHPENGDTEREIVRTRRKKRKGRARTISTNSQPSTRRRTRVNSTDSYITSGDESSLLSPPLPSNSAQESPLHEPRHTRSMTLHDTSINDNSENLTREYMSPEPVIQNKILNTPGSQVSDMSSPGQVNTAAGLLLALANGGTNNGTVLPPDPQKSPEADGNSSGSNSSLQSSPSTPLSSACLLVAAAVGPLEPGFKFPKTKKAIMNEWLNKSPDHIQSSMSPMSMHSSMNIQDIQNEPVIQQQSSIEYYNSATTTNKSLATLVQAASLCDSPPQAGVGKNITGQGAGNAKKRWLRQAISEECDSPCSRPESPPGAPEMVAPPKKRRLARESLSSEQSFTPPTTPTMLVPPSNSLVDEDYPNNDEEFYTNEDRNTTLSDSSPPAIDDSIAQKEPNIRSQRLIVDIGYNSGNTQIGTDGGFHQHGHEDLHSDDNMKERVDIQMEFGSMKSDSDIVKKYPEVLPTSLLDPRLGRDPRPMFRDSAQLLGCIEKTIHFYEENLTGPVNTSETIHQTTLPPPVIPSTSPIITDHTVGHTSPLTVVNSVPQQHVVQVDEVVIPIPPTTPNIVNQVPVIPTTSTAVISSAQSLPPPEIITSISVKEKVSIKPEMVTPAKRKLSISEYRQRKQLKPPTERSGGSCTPERVNSPETPPPPITILTNLNTTTTGVITTVATNTTSSVINTVKPRPRSRSASTSSTSSLSSDEEILGGSNVIADNTEPKASVAESQGLVAFNSAPTAVERQRENVERLKKAFGLTLDDESRRSTLNNTSREVQPPPKPTLKSPPNIPPVNNSLTTSDLLAKIEPSSTTKLMLGLETTKFSETKFSLDTKFSADIKFSSEQKFLTKRLRSPSPEKILAKNPSPEPDVECPTEKESKISDDFESNRDKEIDDAYSKFEESVSTVYIPSFNNPVYPNSTQYTGFSSVIDTSPYEGRNPSPPPSELLKTCYK